jgi:hypothetical protein
VAYRGHYGGQKRLIAYSPNAKGGVFCHSSDSSTKISFFFLSPLFFFLGFGIRAKLLKIQLYSPIYICFGFGPHSFDFYFF